MTEIQDYILLIFNCKRYQFKAQKQKDSWLPNLSSSIIYFHVIGDPELTNSYQFLTDENILLVKVEDDYNSLPKKVIRAYEAVQMVYQFKYIFKTDDDQLVTNIKFFDTIMSLLNRKYDDPDSIIHYGGHVVDVKQPYQSQYYRIHAELPKNLLVQATKYCSGRFYFLSQESTSYLIQEKKQDIELEFLEDYAIGYYLKDLYKMNMLPLDTNKYFVDFC